MEWVEVEIVKIYQRLKWMVSYFIRGQSYKHLIFIKTKLLIVFPCSFNTKAEAGNMYVKFIYSEKATKFCEIFS